MLTLKRAQELNDTMVTEEHLILHAKNVCYAMGAMARHFGIWIILQNRFAPAEWRSQI